MGLFGRKEPSRELVPANLMARWMEEDPSLPRGDRFCGIEPPRWATREELEREMEAARASMPTVEELLKDPDVRAFVEAVGDGACLLAVTS